MNMASRIIEKLKYEILSISSIVVDP